MRPSKINGLPFLERNVENGASYAEQIKNQAAKTLRNSAEKLNIEVLIVESAPMERNPTVNLYFWCRQSESPLFSNRVRIEIIAVPMDYCRYPVQLTFIIHWGFRVTPKVILGIVGLNEKESDNLLKALIANTKVPRFNRCRSLPWQFWLPKNSVKIIRPDWEKRIIVTLFIILPYVMPFFDARFGLITLPFWITAAVLGLKWRRHRLIYSSGRPVVDPIIPIALDEWHSAIRGLGQDVELFKNDLLEDIEKSLPAGAIVSTYPESYVGEDEVVHTERVLVRMRRACVFLDIEGYMGDLYVGWESKTNAGTWSEFPVGIGVHRETGDKCKVMTIRGGWHVPQRMDVQDTNFLGELIHAKVKFWINHYTELRAIKDQINFEVIRGNRLSVEGRADKIEVKKKRHLFSRTE